MNHRMRKLALAVGLALSFGGVGVVFADDAKPKESVAQNISDARREGQIWSSYAMNPHLKAFDLKVEVRGNKATLDGKVESGVAKDLAEQIARGVEGIQHVDNRIVVDANYEAPKRAGSDRTFGEKVEDATITASVKSKLLWNSHTDGLDINVDTANGQVTLTGVAKSGAEKDLARRIARNTSGVVGVNNQLVVGAPGKMEVAKAEAKEEKAEMKARAHDSKEALKEETRETKVAAKENANEAKSKTREVAHESKEAVTDTWITTKVKSTLLLSRNVDGLDIKVTTRDGIVSLAGDVDSTAERDRAVDLASNIRGVKKVDPSGIKIR